MNRNGAPVCLVDDDETIREAVGELLRAEGMEIETFATAVQFMTRLKEQAPGCLILDVNLPELNGFDLQRELKRLNVPVPIIFLTGYGSIPMSVRAIKAGAMEFMTKPFDPDELLDAIHESMLAREIPTDDGKTPGDMIGGGSVFRMLLKQIDMVAPTDSTVLIVGETGTGKELAAHEIHRKSRRKDGPFIRVNCASIPKELYESEFFGHARGSFTGAIRDRAGRFEAANGGTLFLDEIGEIPLDLQSKLLRALQEKQFERVGEDRTRQSDVRVIAATNRDLQREVEQGRFRQDLYYRLNVFPLEVPPLRKRREDIATLATHFVGALARELKCPKPRLTEAGLASLQNHDWPGNIRELRNVIERASIVAQGGALEFDLPIAAPCRAEEALIQTMTAATAEFLTEPELQRRERDNLLVVLNKTNWKIKGADGAAELLGVKPTTLIARIKKMGLNREFGEPLAGCAA